MSTIDENTVSFISVYRVCTSELQSSTDTTGNTTELFQFYFRTQYEHESHYYNPRIKSSLSLCALFQFNSTVNFISILLEQCQSIFVCCTHYYCYFHILSLRFLLFTVVFNKVFIPKKPCDILCTRCGRRII